MANLCPCRLAAFRNLHDLIGELGKFTLLWCTLALSKYIARGNIGTQSEATLTPARSRVAVPHNGREGSSGDLMNRCRSQSINIGPCR